MSTPENIITATSEEESVNSNFTIQHSPSEQAATAFWNINIPLSRHAAECPSYLLYALTNDKDRVILSTPDADYHRQSWAEVQSFIHTNRLDLFQRLPSDLRRYREYCAKLVDEYGSIMAFVMQARLNWTSLEPTGKFFQHPDDYKILLNDWPYGVDDRIKHLVVWTKFELPENPGMETLTTEAWTATEEFVNQRFVSTCRKENVIWFKNWASLKSIHAVEHFHVMLFDPPRGFVEAITGGDVALADKVKD